MRTYIINLDKRKDRLGQLNCPFEYVRFPAVDGTTLTDVPLKLRGHAGCQLSHIGALELLDASGDDYGLILEDDAVFMADFEYRFGKILESLPEDWDLLYLGGWNKRIRMPFTYGIDVAEEVWQTHAYVIRKKFIQTALETLRSRLWKVDVVLAGCLPMGKCFICNPTLVDQSDSSSDVSNKKYN